MNTQSVLNELRTNGYFVSKEHFSIKDSTLTLAENLTNDESYKVGRSYKTNMPETMAPELVSLVSNSQIEEVFKSIEPTTACQDIFITHEYKNDLIERNNWLHFDRLRSLKAMVYLTDVKEDCGPLSLVPGSHKQGKELRHNFKEIESYEEKPNRIEIDYPELMTAPIPIYAGAGTLILFDTDIFHKGGDVADNKERKIIRSHWYPDFEWRVNS